MALNGKKRYHHNMGWNQATKILLRDSTPENREKLDEHLRNRGINPRNVRHGIIDHNGELS